MTRPIVKRFDNGLLTPAETASYLEIPQSTLSSWLKGKTAGAPLVHRVERLREGQPPVPFIEVRLSEIREATAAVRDAFDTPYGLVSRRIATDGVSLLVEHGWAPGDRALSDHLRRLTWEPGDDFPSSLRLRQYPDSVPVVIDPRFGHGLPVVSANRVPVKTITGLWEAGESVEDIAYDYDMTPEQVDALCQAVVHLAA
ncbi:DUF433 domain-containing protein [Streptomyces sp. Amel2xC10]|uniref:DUF433 domain-containing protein n=1 Tax=Streptomyces sp. Amel2xC10 TaxID=1305826 RepID=UPI000A08F064|nr:DUF433 domain-containing protein [Streptomyces sp. Amel2xC10]SMF56625.1 Uncharacterized conserved protein [Streptomyces sp. Amel2xC10]